MTMLSRMSLAEARDLGHDQLIDRCEALLKEYDRPEIETETERLNRITRILEEMPQIYRWFLQLFSFCDHWTDSTNDMFGRTDKRYKALRQRRDLFENMAKAAKARYDGASRLITVIEGFDPTGLPRTRRVRDD